MEELNALSDLLGAPKATGQLNLNLFPGDDTPASGDTHMIEITKVSREEIEKVNPELCDVMKDMSVDAPAADEADGALFRVLAPSFTRPVGRWAP